MRPATQSATVGAAAHFVGGDPHGASMPMDCFVWLVTNAERTLVVDTGFDWMPSPRTEIVN